MNAVSNISIENARIIFRNFSGEESKFNKKGSRNFGVLLDVDLAALMKKDGWNVKELPPREDGDIPTYWLPVSVAFGHIPPKIMQATLLAIANPPRIRPTKTFVMATMRWARPPSCRI